MPVRTRVTLTSASLSIAALLLALFTASDGRRMARREGATAARSDAAVPGKCPAARCQSQHRVTGVNRRYLRFARQPYHRIPHRTFDEPWYRRTSHRTVVQCQHLVNVHLHVNVEYICNLSFNPFPYPGIRRRLRPSRPSSLADANGAPVGLW